jgi:hypothetical protein
MNLIQNLWVKGVGEDERRGARHGCEQGGQKEMLFLDTKADRFIGRNAPSDEGVPDSRR